MLRIYSKFVSDVKKEKAHSPKDRRVIDQTLGDQAASFVLENGTRGDFPADFVLYHCDPTYDWSPINQLKRALKDKIGTAKLSVRVLPTR